MALYAHDAHSYHQSLRCRPGLLLLLLLLAAALFPSLLSTLHPLQHVVVLAAAPPLYAAAAGDEQAPPAANHWSSGHASFYGEHNAAGTMGGACGYGNIYNIGYGVATAALSTTLFNQGLSCGACFEVKCNSLSNIAIHTRLSMYQHDDCLGGEPSIVVTATNLCPPNANMVPEGSWCNPPSHHFDLAKPLFHTIARLPASIVPILYRRVLCEREGGIHFTINGTPSLSLVLVSNVGGVGDVQSVSIKTSSSAKWIKMKRSWGQNWQYDGSLLGQTISFKVQTSDEKVLISYEVVPKDWKFGQTFEGDQFH